MEHTRRAAEEGWRSLLRVALIAVPLLVSPWLIAEIGLIWKWIWTAIVATIALLVISHALVNLRSEGTFLCRLGENEFIQEVPVASCGETFTVKLDAITDIELNNDSSPEWSIRTVLGRHPISNSYGNPARKFVKAIRQRLPHLEITARS